METPIRFRQANIVLTPMDTSQEAVECYTEWVNDREIAHWIGKNNTVTTYAQEREWADKKAVDKVDLNFNIRYIKDDVSILIGNCSLHPGSNPANGCFSIGILIGNPEYRNKGIGTHVVKMLIDMAFKELNAHNVYLTLNGDNDRAYKCYFKAGLKECGRLKEALYYNGKYTDRVFMQITRSEYDR